MYFSLRFGETMGINSVDSTGTTSRARVPWVSTCFNLRSRRVLLFWMSSRPLKSTLYDFRVQSPLQQHMHPSRKDDFTHSSVIACIKSPRSSKKETILPHPAPSPGGLVCNFLLPIEQLIFNNMVTEYVHIQQLYHVAEV